MATQPLVIAKNKVRRALREMLICAAVVALAFAIFAATQPGSFGIFTVGSALFVGFICCPIAWGIYRIGRFTLNR